MRTHYKCKNCGYECDAFNESLSHCPSCFYSSPNTDVSSWAYIQYYTFNEDIETSLKDGTFQKAFPEVTG